MAASPALAITSALAVAACHVDAAPPPAVGCSEMADHVLALIQPKDAHARTLRDTIEHRCDADRWSERTRSCIADEPSLDAKRGCRDTLTASQRASLESALAGLDTGPVAQQVPQAQFAACAAAPLPSCAEYCQSLMTLADCNTLPQATRDVMRSRWTQVMAAWSSLPPDALAQVCTQSVQMMQQLSANWQCGP